MNRVAVTSALGAIALGHSAWAQAPGEGQEEVDARSVLAAEIADVEGAIAELQDLIAWQHEMIRAASSDPAGTLRQRRPMAECRASPLAPVCPYLAALFHDDAPANTGEGARIPESEDEEENAP
ncbi:MAG: hypothetical protein F4Y57_11410 [Acidobacteria bacterium]|nr:hypothetical protein [Acidobacteriota bacterium]